MFYPSFRTFFVVAILPLAWANAQAQAGPPAHPERPKIVGQAKWAPSPQEVSTAYWTLEPGWNTELEMRNNLVFRELTVTPILRVASGHEVSLPPVTLSAQHILLLDLRAMAQSQPQILNANGLFGSVAFRFNGLDSANLFAAAIVHREGQPIDFHFDANEAGSPLYPSGGLEGMWWVPTETSTAYVILSNPAKKSVTGSLVLSMPTTNRRIPLSIGPGQTQRIDLRQTLGPSSVGVMGGLTLALPGHESLTATDIVFDEATGLTAIMKLFDREPADESKTHLLLAPMMALSQPDPGLAFPSGTMLVPLVFLRNAGLVRAQVSLTLDWRSEATSGQSVFPAVDLLPGEMEVVNLANPEMPMHAPDDARWGTVKLNYTGRRADLVAIALSYDKDHRYGLQTPFSENVSRLWAGGMWHVDPSHDTFITTGNVGSESTATEVTLFYNGGKGKYRLEKMLSPGNQLWLDVGQLIRDQVPDSDGHALPSDAMNGSYELRDLDHATVGELYEGKLVIDKTYGHASYGCANCCGLQTPTLDPTPFGGPPNIYNNDFIQTIEQCGGYVDDVTDQGYSWSSSNTAVATLPTRTLHTVAVGTATGGAFIKLQWTHPYPLCPVQTFNPLQQLTVASVSCSPSSITRGGTTTCTATGPTGSTFSNWKFTDSSNSTVTSTSTSNKWSGTVVTGGTISVKVTSSSGSATPNFAISVTNRTNFAFTAVAPTQASGNSITCYDGSTTSLPSPPVPTAFEGASCADLAFSFQSSAPISDNGPNNGYQYVTSVSSTSGSQPTQFPYIVVSDLLSATTFYNKQCGNYSSTNSSGFIAGSQLKQNVLDHEQGSVLSHWTEYRGAQNSSSNNIGTILEAMTAPPNTSQSTFINNLNSAGTTAINNIKAAAAIEPCNEDPAKDSSQSCAKCGAINYSPYQTCSGQPVPYCN